MPIILKNINISVDDFWDDCTIAEREQLRDLVMEKFELPHLGLDLPLDESVIEYMIEMYGNAMTAQARGFVKEQIKELIWKFEHRRFS
jgi:SOS response regulatory protein OraA/RecX